MFHVLAGLQFRPQIQGGHGLQLDQLIEQQNITFFKDKAIGCQPERQELFSL